MRYKRPLVYIIGPYEHGDKDYNVSLAMKAGDFVKEKGGYPIVPHLSHFHDLQSPQPREWWLELTMAQLLACHLAVRIPGYSEGGDKEEEAARERGMPVWYLQHTEEGFAFREEYPEYKKYTCPFCHTEVLYPWMYEGTACCPDCLREADFYCFGRGPYE